jgi:hypothetical protein
MSKGLPPIADADFWWVRYAGGLVAPLLLALWGGYSVLSQHSYAIWALRARIRFVPVTGEQAVLMGVAYLGVGIALFANCYAQYHQKMAYYYQWILAPGALMAGGGILWCSSIFLFG